MITDTKCVNDFKLTSEVLITRCLIHYSSSERDFPCGDLENNKKMKLEIVFISLWALSEAATSENGNLTTYEGIDTVNEQAVNVHSRRKRYIVFPKGSSLQLLLELLVHVPTEFRVVVGPTLQVAWPLPSERLENYRTKRSPLSGDWSLRHHMSHFKNFFRFKDAPPGESSAGKRYKIFSDFATLLDLFGMTVGLAWQLPDDPMIYSEYKKKHKIYKRNALKKMEAFLRPGGANGRQCVLKALCESGQRTPSKKEFLREILHKIFSIDEDEDFEENEEDKLYRKAHQSLNQDCDALYPDCQFSVFNAIQ